MNKRELTYLLTYLLILVHINKWPDRTHKMSS